jgi:hypothetical protein
MGFAFTFLFEKNFILSILNIIFWRHWNEQHFELPLEWIQAAHPGTGTTVSPNTSYILGKYICSWCHSSVKGHSGGNHQAGDLTFKAFLSCFCCFLFCLLGNCDNFSFQFTIVITSFRLCNLLHQSCCSQFSDFSKSWLLKTLSENWNGKFSPYPLFTLVSVVMFVRKELSVWTNPSVVTLPWYVPRPPMLSLYVLLFRFMCCLCIALISQPWTFTFLFTLQISFYIGSTLIMLVIVFSKKRWMDTSATFMTSLGAYHHFLLRSAFLDFLFLS